MTQFMLCIPDPAAVLTKLEFRRIANDEAWLHEQSRLLFSDMSVVRVPQLKNGISMSDLFTAAHNALQSGHDFRATELAAVLPEMANACTAFVLWWGNDSSDLPVVTVETALCAELERQLKAPVGDVYLRWSRDAPIEEQGAANLG